MRIFQVIESSTNASLKANRTWYRNLHEPLVDLGCDVFLFPAEDGRRAMQENDASLRASFSSKMLDAFRREHSRKPFDLAFFYLMEGMFDPGAIDEIRRLGVITTNFSCNNTHQFYLVADISKHFDVNLYSEKEVKAKFGAIGVNAVWWPMASNPKYFHPVNLPRTIQASFVGANYALRARFIHYLLKKGVDVQVFGPGWAGNMRKPLRSNVKRSVLGLRSLLANSLETRSNASAALAEYDFNRMVSCTYPDNLHGPISDDELISLYSRSHISLGFLEVYDAHDPNAPVKSHLHLREFEAPMCGALYVTGYLDELTELFEPDKEVVIYRNHEELVSKVRYYLDCTAEAEKVRRAGRERALRDHTYHKRFEQLFSVIGLKGKVSR
jgi:spore maturation protein CgeB